MKFKLLCSAGSNVSQKLSSWMCRIKTKFKKPKTFDKVLKTQNFRREINNLFLYQFHLCIWFQTYFLKYTHCTSLSSTSILDMTPPHKKRHPPQKKTIWWWCSCSGVSYVHFDPPWSYHSGSHLWIKLNYLILLWLKPFYGVHTNDW